MNDKQIILYFDILYSTTCEVTGVGDLMKTDW